MPKLKTRKSALKRYKKTGTDKFVRKHAYKGHLLMKKSNKQKRKLATQVCVEIADAKVLKLILPY